MENVRRLAHEHLLPALERFTVLVSRLRGLSKFQASNINLGLSTQGLDDVLDTVNCLQLLAHHVMIASGNELRQFQAFSVWLRHAIDTQGTDTSTADNEKDVNIDYTNTLEFIEGAMMKSRLSMFFDTQGTANDRPQWDLNAEGRSLFDLYSRELKNQSVNSPSAKELPHLDALIMHLDAQCNNVFRIIADTQRRIVRFGSPVFLRAGIPQCMDSHIVIEVRLECSMPSQSINMTMLRTLRNPRIRYSTLLSVPMMIKILVNFH